MRRAVWCSSHAWINAFGHAAMPQFGNLALAVLCALDAVAAVVTVATRVLNAKRPVWLVQT
jgi:hypothetical protein